MDVKLAKTAGFCFGVKRAIETVEEQIKAANGKKIYTYGPIINNTEVVNDLKSRGVEVIERPEDIPLASGSTLILRSHGVAKSIYDIAEKNGVNLVDATCPFVKKIHRIVGEKSAEGYSIVIIGDASHPEVQGIVGWCSAGATVIGSENEAESLNFDASDGKKLCIVSQTTFNAEKFQYFVEIVNKKGYDTVVINTICSATAERQKEAADISVQVDKMLVIGDLKSSNTRKLFEICKSHCEDTYHIQTVRDLPVSDLRSDECVGITAGASTPNYLIQEVLLLCQRK